MFSIKPSLYGTFRRRRGRAKNNPLPHQSSTQKKLPRQTPPPSCLMAARRRRDAFHLPASSHDRGRGASPSSSLCYRPPLLEQCRGREGGRDIRALLLLSSLLLLQIACDKIEWHRGPLSRPCLLKQVSKRYCYSKQITWEFVRGLF